MTRQTLPFVSEIRVITQLPNSEQSYKGKVKTHNYINRQNQSTSSCYRTCCDARDKVCLDYHNCRYSMCIVYTMRNKQTNAHHNLNYSQTCIKRSPLVQKRDSCEAFYDRTRMWPFNRGDHINRFDCIS